MEEFSLEHGESWGGVVVDGEEDISLANTRSLGGGTGRHLLGAKTAMRFHPPDTIGRNIESHFLTQIQDGEDGRRHRREGEDNSQHTSLERILHDGSDGDSSTRAIT